MTMTKFTQKAAEHFVNGCRVGGPGAPWVTEIAIIRGRHMLQALMTDHPLVRMLGPLMKWLDYRIIASVALARCALPAITNLGPATGYRRPF